MNNKIKSIIEKFLEEFQKEHNIVGVLVCGSYITRNSTEHSDIDLHIVLDDNCDYRERGNKIIDNILIEYFANPKQRILQYFDEDFENRRQVNAHMYHTGEILFDSTGAITEIKKIAKEKLNQTYTTLNNIQIELLKYDLWDKFDNLEEVYKRDEGDFNFVYYNYLSKLLEGYLKYLGYLSIDAERVFRCLYDEKYQKKYIIPNFPDLKFLELFKLALLEEEKSQQINLCRDLKEYVLNKMGGIDVDGWSIKTPL